MYGARSNYRNTNSDQWKPEWTPSKYLIAIVRNGKTEITELAAMDDDRSMNPNRDLGRYVNHYAVQVVKSSHRGFQYHRFVLGTIISDGKFVSSIAPRVEGVRDGNPQIDNGAWDAVYALMGYAEEHQEDDSKKQCEEYAARQNAREQADEKPEERPTRFAYPNRGDADTNSNA